MSQYCEQCKERQDTIDKQAEQIKTKNEALEMIALGNARITGHLTGEDCQRIAEKALKGSD